MKKKLTDQIEFEIQNVEMLIKDLMQSIPADLYHLKSYAAERIAGEAVNWGSSNHYEALGILEETKLTYRDISMEVIEGESD